MPTKRKPMARQLGAVSDKPDELIDRALAQYNAASNDDPHNVDARLAAELGWLALNSFADIVGKRLGMPAGHSASRRVDALEAIDSRVPRLRSRDTFTAARDELHGQCFYEDMCPTPARTRTLLANIKDVIDDGTRALDNPRTLKKRR